jgi:hypothetical protein
MQGLYDRVVLVCFVACGVSRLARYNVTAEALSGGGDKVKYFEGTPIPTSLLLVIVLAIATWQGAIGPHLWLGVVDLRGSLHPLVLLSPSRARDGEASASRSYDGPTQGASGSAPVVRPGRIARCTVAADGLPATFRGGKIRVVLREPHRPRPVLDDRVAPRRSEASRGAIPRAEVRARSRARRARGGLGGERLRCGLPPRLRDDLPVPRHPGARRGAPDR